MGIFKYNSWIKNTFQKCILEEKNIKFDHVYIDVNYLLHLSMYQSTNDKQFYTKLYNLIDYILINCFAIKSIMFSIDGTSPYSKIILQRKRRFNNIHKINMNQLNSLYLTPGTHFMNNIKGKIKEYINNRKKWFKFRKIKFFISSTNIPGEGEIKIIKKVKKLSKLNKKSSHLIIGNDADLIVISMACIYSKNLFVMLKGKNENLIISIDKLTTLFSNLIKSKKKLNLKKIRTDFSIVSIMNGNDYLPKLQYSKNKILWYSYIKTKSKRNDYLINNGLFNNNFLKEFITNIIVELRPSYNKFSIINFNKKKIIKYLEGLLWCINMYKTGKCSMCDFIYNDKSPKPIEILNFLLINKNINININIPKSDIQPIKTSIYPLLLLPKKASILIPDKFKSIVQNNLNHIYEQENCEICNSLNNEINKNKLDLEKYVFDEDKILNIVNKIKELNSKLKNHKKIHKFNFNVNDIKFIVNLNK